MTGVGTESHLSPVRAPSTFEATVARLGRGIRLGVLPAGSRLPAERDLAEQLGISRSTLRQALEVLHESGHLESHRGRGGGTFVAERPPLTQGGPGPLPAAWRETVGLRRAVEVGVACLAAERAARDPGGIAATLAELDAQARVMDNATDRFADYRRADVAFHLALAEATEVGDLVLQAARVQAATGELIAHIAHPPAVLRHANAEHRALRTAIGAGDRDATVRLVCAHLEGTELILEGLARAEPGDAA